MIILRFIAESVQEAEAAVTHVTRRPVVSAADRAAPLCALHRHRQDRGKRVCRFRTTTTYYTGEGHNSICVKAFVMCGIFVFQILFEYLLIILLGLPRGKTVLHYFSTNCFLRLRNKTKGVQQVISHAK